MIGLVSIAMMVSGAGGQYPEHSVVAIGVGDIDGNCHGIVSTQLGHDILGTLMVAVRNGQLGAEFALLSDHGPANTAGTTRDQCHTAGEIHLI